MDTRVLVAYATKYGATAEIAEKIGQVILRASSNLKAQAAPATGSRASALHMQPTTPHQRGKNHDVHPMNAAKSSLEMSP